MPESDYTVFTRQIRKEMFVLLLSAMDLSIESCRSAQLRSDLEAVQGQLRRAKSFYGWVLMRSSYYLITAQDVSALELRSGRLENEICKLEMQLRKVQVVLELSSGAVSHC